MPLPMVHLTIAHTAVHSAAPRDPASYYLGVLAPDAVHMRAHPDEAAKFISHLRWDAAQGARLTAPAWREAIIARYRQHPQDDFTAGYCIHLLSDLIWSNTTFKFFDTLYRSDAAPLQARSPAYYNDTDIIDLELYHTSPWRPAVWSLLAGTNGQALPGCVTADEVDAWKERTLAWYGGRNLQQYLPLRYLCMADILGFISTAVDAVLQMQG